MLSSAGAGLLKGLLVGVLVGVGLTYGLRWPMPAGGLLGYLAVVAVGGTTGVLAGRAPWRENAWLEALIKCAIGAAVSAGLYGLACRYGDAYLPAIVTDRLHIPTRVSAVDVPLSWLAFGPLSLSAVGVILGLFIELDHALDANKDVKNKASKPKKRTDAFVAGSPRGELEGDAQSTRPSKRIHERRD